MRLAAAQRWPAFENAAAARPAHGCVEVGVVADDEGVLAAELGQTLARRRPATSLTGARWRRR